MNTFKMSNLWVVLLVFSVSLSSCEEDDVNDEGTGATLSVVNVADLPADPENTGVPTYYSLKDSAIVAAADSLTDKWDIAVTGTSILLNGGSALVVDGIFEELTEAPADGYEAGAVPKTWYYYNPSTHIVTTVAGKLIVVKLADGTYAKMEVTSYYKGSPDLEGKAASDIESRYYTFRYAYQSDGSTSFEIGE